MATVEFRYDPKNTAWFTANAAMVLKAGEPAYHDTTGLFKLGDGVTALSALSFLPIVSSATPTLQQVLNAGSLLNAPTNIYGNQDIEIAKTDITNFSNNLILNSSGAILGSYDITNFISSTLTLTPTNATFTKNVTALSFTKSGGTSSQFLKADGTVDSNVYGVGDALTTNPLSQFAATTSSQLAGVISDETGTGALVFGTSPNFSGTPTISNISIPTISSINNLTNKRITLRVTTITSSSTPTINTDNCDAVTITALAAAITSFTTNLTGSPNNFDKLMFRIKDNGTARAITWGASFEAKGVALPTTTVINKNLTVGFIYESLTSKWGCVASSQEA